MKRESQRMRKADYMRDPCGASPLPYWKAKDFRLPPGMKIVKDSDFHPGLLARYVDTPYFKAMAPLAGRERPELPAGLEASTADDAGFSEHIGACYADEWISAGDLRRERALPVYDPALWLALRDRRTGGIAASGIAQLDPAAGEGVLDWIQVSPDWRRRGLGQFIVRELLFRMQGKAAFVTVSGKAGDETRPDLLYQSCGFSGWTLWHILREKRN